MENNGTILFLLTTIMELATLVCAYLGVRLYRRKWQLRMALIVVPLVLNATTPFFYLGVVLLLCIPFVWPRKKSA